MNQIILNLTPGPIAQAVTKEKQYVIELSTRFGVTGSNVQWKEMTTISFEFTLITGLPSTISKCTSLKYLFLTNCCLVYVPPEIGLCERLEVVDFSRNQIKELPKEIGNWEEVTDIYFNHNRIKELPKEIGALYNNIEKLPEEIEKWEKLSTLLIVKNKLTKFPLLPMSVTRRLIFLSENLSRRLLNVLKTLL